MESLEIQHLRAKAEEEGTVRGVQKKQTQEMTQERKMPKELKEKVFQRRRGCYLRPCPQRCHLG